MSKSTGKKQTVTILTAPKGAGKTTYLLDYSAMQKSRGEKIFGLCTPKAIKNGQVIGIDAVDVSTGQKTPFALRDDLPGIRIGPWRFLSEGIAFGQAACAHQGHRGICIIDEIGPLELSGQGLTGPLEALKHGQYESAIVVVRPELVEIIRPMIAGQVRVVQLGDGLE